MPEDQRARLGFHSLCVRVCCVLGGAIGERTKQRGRAGLHADRWRFPGVVAEAAGESDGEPNHGISRGARLLFRDDPCRRRARTYMNRRKATKTGSDKGTVQGWITTWILHLHTCAYLVRSR
jgi:hypothetical protein